METKAKNMIKKTNKTTPKNEVVLTKTDFLKALDKTIQL
jgi:hypothetical protein